VLLLGSAGLQASPSSTPSAPTLPIGLLAPPDPSEATSLRQGAMLGIEHANAIPGAKARLVVRGRPGQWGTEGDEAVGLALDEGVAAIITPSGGSAAHQILQVAGRTQVPVVSLCSDTSVTGAGVPWAVRIVPRTDEEARAIFSGVPASLAGRKPLRWAALVPPDRAGREAARDLQTAAAAAGCRLTEPTRVQTTNGYQAQVSEVLAARPDAVLLWTEPRPAADLARSLRQAGFDGQLAGPSRLCSESFLQSAGKAAEGLVLATLAVSSEGRTSQIQFATEYQKHFSTPADPLAAMAHDAVLLLVHVLRASAPEVAFRSFPLREAVTGTSGPIQFDASGNRLSDLTLVVCEGGHFKPLAGIDGFSATNAGSK
jgi:branched-chain amino acid transport system substrate-binding protein